MKLERQYTRSLINKLELTDDNSPSEYWNILKNLRKNSRAPVDESIQCNDWVSHFESIYNNSSTTKEEKIVSEELFELERITRLNNYLNVPIERNELLAAIKQMKKNTR